MKKILVVLAVAILLIVTFSGCVQPAGDGKVTNPEQAGTATADLGQGIDNLIGSLDEVDKDISG